MRLKLIQQGVIAKSMHASRQTIQVMSYPIPPLAPPLFSSLLPLPSSLSLFLYISCRNDFLFLSLFLSLSNVARAIRLPPQMFPSLSVKATENGLNLTVVSGKVKLKIAEERFKLTREKKKHFIVPVSVVDIVCRG